jgi:hypothetical protein
LVLVLQAVRIVASFSSSCEREDPKLPSRRAVDKDVDDDVEDGDAGAAAAGRVGS